MRKSRHNRCYLGEKAEAEDDVETYLESFEKVAMVTKWDPRSWVAKLGPLLICPAQAAYQALNRAKAQGYKKVKEVILYHLEISPETYQHKFRAQKGPEGDSLDYWLRHCGIWPNACCRWRHAPPRK